MLRREAVPDAEFPMQWKCDWSLKVVVLLSRRIMKVNVIKALGSFLRYCWVLPVSCIGILLIPFVLFSGGTVSIAAGVIEAEGGILRFLLSRRPPHFTIDAITIGHVIFGKNRKSLIRCRNHERVHVRQYERWGLLFPLLYLLSSAAAMVRGMDPYRDNRFELEAFRASDAGMTAKSSEYDQSTKSQS